VELIKVLPLNYKQTAGMKQAMPSCEDLEGVMDYRQGQRVVAGYEVLLNHWREQHNEIERLQNENAELAAALACREAAEFRSP
jgi:hypothetical protein